MIIAVDFDGTCVSHEFPLVGNDIGAVPVLKALVANGHKLILWTMRSDKKKIKGNDYGIESTSGMFLTDAINWFKENDIPLFGVQKNPTQHKWTSSRKCYAQMYIDDAAFGCPLIYNESVSNRPFVNWDVIKNHLINDQTTTQ